jgi:hypothetical protein
MVGHNARARETVFLFAWGAPVNFLSAKYIGGSEKITSSSHRP